MDVLDYMKIEITQYTYNFDHGSHHECVVLNNACDIGRTTITSTNSLGLTYVLHNENMILYMCLM